MTYAVTGSRWVFDAAYVADALAAIVRPGDTLVLGDARGVDAMALEYATQARVPYRLHVANWEQYGRAAGPIRNSAMLRDGVDTLVAFLRNAGPGTRDCIAQARHLGIPVYEVPA